MAIYHCSIKIISRGKGKSAVAAAAYRSGGKILNEYDGLEHEYTRKGGIAHTEILLPDNAPAEYSDRAFLWNAVEKIEKAKNSQLAREIEIALPVELTPEQQKNLVREYCQKHFVAAGMCADIAIHDKKDGNPHAHIMLTMRPFADSGEWGDKQKKEYIFDRNGNKIYDPKKRQYKCKSIPSTDWNEQTKAEEWRGAWAELCNQFLEHNNHTGRIDHRSYARQGIDKIPTVHMGVAAAQMERRGIATERGNLNRQIEVTNQRLRQLKARIIKLKHWVEETPNTAPPTLADIVHDILSRRKQSRYQSISNLKAAARLLAFLQENHIKDMAGLEEKVTAMYAKQLEIRDTLKPMEQRLKVLDEHIKQAGYYLQFRGLYRTYKQEKPKHQEAFAEAHRREITLFEAADRYLKGAMNGKTGLPIKAWKAEHSKLTTEKNKLNQAYAALKNEVWEVEKIKRGVDEIMREEKQKAQPKRTQDMDI